MFDMTLTTTPPCGAKEANIFPTAALIVLIAYLREPDHGGHTLRCAMEAFADVIRFAAAFLPEHPDHPIYGVVSVGMMEDPAAALELLLPETAEARAVAPAALPEWFWPLIQEIMRRLLNG